MKIDRNAILQTFLAETEETLAQMEEALLLLEVRPQDEELLALIFRVAHTLKGNAAALELREVSAFAHTVEELLAVIRKREVAADKHAIDLLLQATDTLKVLTPAAAAGDLELTPSQAELLLRLRDVAAQKATREETAVSPASEHESTASQPATQPGTRTLRVRFDKLDQMLDLAGEIGIAQGRIRQLLEKLDVGPREQLLEAVRETDRLTMELQEQVMELRMIPIGPTFHRYERLVRDLANARGKKVRLVVEGEDAGVDSAVIDLIRDPLTHMIRNAIDHGIETPEVRAANGKDPQGTVKLNAFREAGTFVIQLSDEGAGLNRARILERARALDITLDAERLSSEELARLVFEAGFSTAKEVTETSGRGVGMDVVRRNVEALHGRVELHTVEGHGVTITLRLPLTLAIIEGFSVGVGKERFVLPLDAVVECMELSGNCLKGNDGQGVMTLRGEPLPFIRLRNVLRLQSTTQRQNVVVVRQAGTCAGIVVDALYGEHQAVIKPLGKLFQDIPAIAGSTVLGDGSIALVLDVPGLFRTALAQPNGPELTN